MRNHRNKCLRFFLHAVSSPLLWLGVACGTLHAQEPVNAAAVDSLFAEWNTPQSPGCVLGIIHDGKLVYGRGYGMASLEDSIPISPATVFNIASMSKQFTAASILLLAQEQKLTLDDDVRKYLPELPDYGATITIRQLLNHTSGLRDYPTLLYFSGVRVEDGVRERDALDMLVRQHALNARPGEEWSYSNTGYFLASLIVKRVAGESLPEFARKRIFLPLGMTHTVWVDDAKQVLAHRAEGYAPKSGGEFQTNTSDWELVGAGGIHTTLGDLSLWDRNFYVPAVGGAALVEQLVTPGTLADGKKLGYGLGLFRETYRGFDVVRHEGEWAGYKAEMFRIPQEKFTVICLCNLSSMNPTQLAKKVVDVCLASRTHPDAAVNSLRPQPRSSVALSLQDTARWIGYYRNPSDETVRRITLEKGTLMYGRVPGTASPLVQTGRDTFEMTGVPARVVLRFAGPDGGHASSMSVAVDSAKPVVFDAFEPAGMTKERSHDYEGTYFSEELNANYTIAARDSQLVVQVRRFDDMPLTPTIKDVFKYQDFRSFTFRRNEEDRIVGFVMSAARAKVIVFAKTNRPAAGKNKS